MTDATSNSINSENGNLHATSMKLRPRRNALSDISNTIAQQFSNMTRKVINKKRKLSSDGVDQQDIEGLNTQEVIDLYTESPQSQGSSSSSRAQMVAMASNPLFTVHDVIDPAKLELQRASDFYGYNVPKIMKRKLPLHNRASDPCQCVEVLDDMYMLYHSLEDQYSAKVFFNVQSEITGKMRSILVDWLVEVHYKYKLQPATLWLCVNILDRYLGKVDTPRNKLQLVGITSLFIACKFEEVHAPEVRDCVYLTDNAYERTEVLQMEFSILQTLEYQLLVPTGYHFLIRLLNAVKATERVRLLASYSAERSLQEVESLQYTSNVYASAALYVALRTANMEHPHVQVWNKTLQEESGLTEEDILPLARTMVTHNGELPQSSTRRKLEAARKKYCTKQMQFISNLRFPAF